MPRISCYLGDVRAVEIGPGYGRLFAYLHDDVTQRLKAARSVQI